MVMFYRTKKKTNTNHQYQKKTIIFLLGIKNKHIKLIVKTTIFLLREKTDITRHQEKTKTFLLQSAKNTTCQYQ